MNLGSSMFAIGRKTTNNGGRLEPSFCLFDEGRTITGIERSAIFRYRNIAKCKSLLEALHTRVVRRSQKPLTFIVRINLLQRLV